MTKRDQDSNDLDSPLGLADEPIVRTAEDHLEGSTDPSSRRRRARALGEDGIDSSGSTQDEHDGATSIDMGYGGDGTNIKSGS